MSEVDARPPSTRGRSSTRGGRGGFGRGGPRGGRRPVNGTAHDTTTLEVSPDDQGELGDMKKKYASELSVLKDMFPDWTDVDLVFALQETDGDVPSTVEKITEGNVSQFAEVKNTKDRARSKVKDELATAGAVDKPVFRGGRGRGGLDATRGGRGRGSERGRGGFRGGRGGHATTNGAPKDVLSAGAATEPASWDTATTVEATDRTVPSAQDSSKDATDDAGQSAWTNVVTSDATPATASEGMKSALIPEGAPKKSWASMFSQPKPAPAPMKQAPPIQPPLAEVTAVEQAPAPIHDVPKDLVDAETPPTPPMLQETTEDAVHNFSPIKAPSVTDAEELGLTPSNVPLTEENVEHLPDESHPPATQTVASTVGSMDTRNLTPLPNQPGPIGRPPLGGFATSAYRAAGLPARSASFQRRVKEQQEAVVMPGHNAVDRAAVQFGSMGLSGEPGLDVDEDREQPETRQAPQHSPPSQPRTSLPPVPRQAAPAQEMPESLPTPKQAPGLPPASSHNQQQMQEATMGHAPSMDQAHAHSQYGQYGRYAQPAMQQESGAQQPKPYDPFGHQQHLGSYEQYSTHPQQHQAAQQQQQQQQASQAGFGGLSSASNDYSSYYTSDQSRNAYNQYYGNTYGQQDNRGPIGQGQQDAGLGQQRSASGYGATTNEPAYSSQAQQQGSVQSRFGDAPGSGNNTPNPLMGSQQPTNPSAQQAQHNMHQAPGHQQQGGYGAGASAAFPYGHPYYNSPYQTAYHNQFGYSQQQSGYGGSGYPAKQGNAYGVPHGYGVGAQSSYEQHSASPANAGAFGQNQQSSMRSASGMGSSLGGGSDEYGRASAQPSSHHQHNSGYGGMNDPFARSTSGFGAQGGYGNAGAGPDDALRPYNDVKSGPSPALGQPGRPGSAANSAVGSSQSGLPPPVSQQPGLGGGYSGFPGQGSQYGGLGGLGSHQQGQSGMGGQGGYGQYGAGGFNQTYGGYGSRGGWGSNYGAH